MTAEFTPEALALMAARSGGDCEINWPNVCKGSEFASELQAHHRRPRGMGGTKRPASSLPSNGLLACLWCHGYLETEERGKARRLGFIVSQVADPARVRVFYRHCDWVLLDNAGDFVVVGDAA